jgi:hypothetical protein
LYSVCLCELPLASGIIVNLLYQYAFIRFNLI